MNKIIIITIGVVIGIAMLTGFHLSDRASDDYDPEKLEALRGVCATLSDVTDSSEELVDEAMGEILGDGSRDACDIVD